MDGQCLRSAELPVAVFDSGVGGLTVLHELLVSLPTEDYSYLGDTARFPYGDRSQEQLRRFAIEIADHLLDVGREAAGGRVQRREFGGARGARAPPGADRPRRRRDRGRRARHAAGRGRQPHRPDRAAGDAGDRGQRRLRARRAGGRSPRSPRERRLPGPGADHPGVAFRSTSRWSRPSARYCAPLRAAEVDTVILGCTHYPLVAPMLQRALGRGVTLSPPAPASRAASSAR